MIDRLLRDRRDEIVRAWTEAVRADLRLGSLERSASRECIPEFLDELAAWISDDRGDAATRLTAAVARHAAGRLGDAHQLRQFLDELRLLRATVLRVVLGPEQAEQARAGADGSSVRVEHLARLNDGFDLVIGGVVEQCTSERERSVALLAPADHALRDREAFLRRVLDASPSMIFVKDDAGRFVLANDALARVYGTASSEIVGKTDADFNPDASQVAAFLRDDRDVMATRREKLIVEEPVRTSDGEERWFSTVKVPIVDDDGTCHHVLGVATDITARKRAEEALRHADRQKDQYLAMLAHELRNPLAAIRSAAEVIRTRLRQGQAVDRPLEILERQVQNSARLLDDLLDVSRITRGLLQLKCAPVHLADVVGSAIDAQRALIEAAEHELSVTLPPEAVLVSGDATRLEQVFSNLLNNAAKYTPQRGRLDVSVRREREGEAEIRVADTGPGISPDLLPRIFEPFAQGEQSLARTTGGLGLGLTLVRRLVELHGGSVEARSRRGGGSEFIVRLPTLESNDPSATRRRPAPGAAAPAATLPCRILLVEDSYDAAELLSEHLTSLGYDVTVAHDGLTALAAAERIDPRIVLLDIGLPGMDGFEVARRLRASARGRAPILVAITGYGQEEDRKRSREVGFVAHLTKPFEPRTLERVIAKYCVADGAERGPSSTDRLG